MAITAVLNPLTLPSGTEWPGTPQLGLNLFCQYAEITGLEELGGVNYGPTTPDAADRDKPWFKTDGSYNPIGWFSWNGSAWTQILFSAPYGTTANRPSSPTTGQFYLDTTINALLIYERSAWRLADGCPPGSIKFFKSTTLAEALTANPGWVQDTESDERVQAAATGATGKNCGDTAGADTVTLTIDELPAVTIDLGLQNDTNGGDHNDSGSDSFVRVGTGLTASFAGGGDPHENRQKTIYRWCLIKS